MSNNASDVSSFDLTALQEEVMEACEAVQTAERKVQVARRQIRAIWGAASLTCLSVLALGLNPQARAQFAPTLTGLDTRLKAMETKTASLSAITDPNTSQPTVRFTGVNVQIISGSGATDGAVNGTGNLIVGYNEARGDGTDARTGSHNIVLGQNNNYSSYGGLVAGASNAISGKYASVSGGVRNNASGQNASISGGESNTASGAYSSVSGGYGNAAKKDYASVSGGSSNTASGTYCSVSGGISNSASGQDASVSAGYGNTASGVFSNVSGGYSNTTSGYATSDSGGGSRTLGAYFQWAAGSLSKTYFSGNLTSQ